LASYNKNMPTPNELRAAIVAALEGFTVSIPDPRNGKGNPMYVDKVWHYTAKVSEPDDKGHIRVTVDENAILREKGSREMLANARALVKAALEAAGISYQLVFYPSREGRAKKQVVWPHGYFHMSQFCCNGRSLVYMVKA
jgi:hypothetical protein